MFISEHDVSKMTFMTSLLLSPKANY